MAGIIEPCYSCGGLVSADAMAHLNAIDPQMIAWALRMTKGYLREAGYTTYYAAREGVIYLILYNRSMIVCAIGSTDLPNYTGHFGDGRLTQLHDFAFPLDVTTVYTRLGLETWKDFEFNINRQDLMALRRDHFVEYHGTYFSIEQIINTLPDNKPVNAFVAKHVLAIRHDRPWGYGMVVLCNWVGNKIDNLNGRQSQHQTAQQNMPAGIMRY